MLHLDGMYASDARGRLTAVRPLGDDVAPRFWLGRTQHGNLWRFRADVPEEQVRVLSRLAAREPIPAEFAGFAPPLPERAAAFVAQLQGTGAAPHVWRGPAFVFPDTHASAHASLAARAQRLEAPEAPLAEAISAGFPDAARALAAGLPLGVACDSERPVAVCWSARHGPGGAHEAGVETLGEARGHGHAAMAVVAWAAAIRERGGTPLYSTHWQNRASLRVAEKLGLRMYAEELHYT